MKRPVETVRGPPSEIWVASAGPVSEAPSPAEPRPTSGSSSRKRPCSDRRVSRAAPPSLTIMINESVVADRRSSWLSRGGRRSPTRMTAECSPSRPPRWDHTRAWSMRLGSACGGSTSVLPGALSAVQGQPVRVTVHERGEPASSASPHKPPLRGVLSTYLVVGPLLARVRSSRLPRGGRVDVGLAPQHALGHAGGAHRCRGCRGRRADGSTRGSDALAAGQGLLVPDRAPASRSWPDSSGTCSSRSSAGSGLERALRRKGGGARGGRRCRGPCCRP